MLNMNKKRVHLHVYVDPGCLNICDPSDLSVCKQHHACPLDNLLIGHFVEIIFCRYSIPQQYKILRKKYIVIELLNRNIRHY